MQVMLTHTTHGEWHTVCDVLSITRVMITLACNAMEQWVCNSMTQHTAQHVHTATPVQNKLKLLLLTLGILCN